MSSCCTYLYHAVTMKRRSFDASLTLRVVDYASVIDAVLAAGFSIPKEMEAAASSRGNTVSYAQRLDVPKPAVSLVSFLEIQLYESDTQDSRTTEWPYKYSDQRRTSQRSISQMTALRPKHCWPQSLVLLSDHTKARRSFNTVRQHLGRVWLHCVFDSESLSMPMCSMQLDVLQSG